MASVSRLFNSLPTKYKILSGIGVPLVFLVVLGAVSYNSVNQLHHTGKWVSFTYEALSKTDAVVAATVDMETGMRGYLLTGKDSFLKPYTQSETRLFKLMDDLQEMFSEMDEKQKMAEKNASPPQETEENRP